MDSPTLWKQHHRVSLPLLHFPGARPQLGAPLLLPTEQAAQCQPDGAKQCNFYYVNKLSALVCNLLAGWLSGLAGLSERLGRLAVGLLATFLRPPNACWTPKLPPNGQLGAGKTSARQSSGAGKIHLACRIHAALSQRRPKAPKAWPKWRSQTTTSKQPESARLYSTLGAQLAAV